MPVLPSSCRENLVGERHPRKHSCLVRNAGHFDAFHRGKGSWPVAGLLTELTLGGVGGLAELAIEGRKSALLGDTDPASDHAAIVASACIGARDDHSRFIGIESRIGPWIAGNGLGCACQANQY